MTGMVEKVYAEAMFQLGLENSAVEEYHQELTELAKLFAENPELEKLLSAPALTAAERLDIVEKLFSGRLSDEVYSFLCLLVEKHRASYLERIASAFHVQYNFHHGIQEITVTTTKPLLPATRKKLIAKLETLTGRQVSLIEKTDPGILGGIVLQMGNTQTDASVRARLEDLRAQLKETIV